MKNQMTMGNFYFARGIDKRGIIEEQLEHVSEDCVYVFLKSDDSFEYEMYENYKNVLHFYMGRIYDRDSERTKDTDTF